MTRAFGAMVLPALSCAVVCYFAYYAIWGSRGVLELVDAQAQLGVQQEKLAEVRGQRLKLQRDIEHMRPGHVDLDLLEQLSREKLMNAAPNQVEISRVPQH